MYKTVNDAGNDFAHNPPYWRVALLYLINKRAKIENKIKIKDKDA